ncbi:Na+/H+ antiporter subunit G [Rhodospirillales bacterium YIM 152171]|uniref:Na+/H+ antiporter subunit G n=1 Tax=Marinimicrococcus flavescens TaxID=3031815 RepID=A0AAP3UZY0_9PROT|nr:Na+/H+ antiporter subunit G [Marinimicrococcus flavescens]
MIATLAEALAAFLILAGGFFALVGSYGLAKLPDLMTRLHGPTKATTLGVGGIVLASMIVAGLEGRLSLHELLIALFLFLTAPVSAFMLAKAHILRDARTAGSLPPTGTETGWATTHVPAGGAGKDRKRAAAGS